MKNLVHSIPFLRITIAFALGILLSGKIFFPDPYLLGFSGLLLIALFMIQKKYSYQLELFAGLTITFLFILFGIVIAEEYNQQPILFNDGKFSGIVLETPQEKENSYKTLLHLSSFYRNDSVFSCNEKVLVYFEKNELIGQLNPGSIILLSTQLQMVENNGNPYEFDYKTYLSRKKIYRQIYLRNSDWTRTTRRANSLPIMAEKTREKLLNIYRKQNLGNEETEILSALTLGYKRGLDPETKRVFSSAGAMHVLAVSGLHVGIIYMVFTFFFGFLQKSKKGKYIFVLTSLLVLWGYAFITGLSPSVMRAATMFSLVCIGANIQRRPNIYNSLAFAAFFLLLINPNNLFEVGFQLSFAAVFGIVFLQPRLEKILPLKNKFLKPVWTLLSVSIAAQITTFPFTSYYFSQFPTYFWLSNLIVIPAAFVMIFLAISLLVFSQVHWISGLLAFLANRVIHFTFVFLQGVENLPMSVLEFGVSASQTITIGLSLIFLFHFLSNQKISTLKAILLSLFILSCLNFYTRYQQLSERELIAYNNPDNPVIHLIHGETNYVISESPIHPGDFINREISTVVTKQNLTKPLFLTFTEQFENEHLWIRNGIVSFNGKVVKFGNPGLLQPENLNASFLIIRQAGNRITDEMQAHQKVINFAKYTPKETASAEHYVNSMGAFHEIWQLKRMQANDH